MQVQILLRIRPCLRLCRRLCGRQLNKTLVLILAQNVGPEKIVGTHAPAEGIPALGFRIPHIHPVAAHNVFCVKRDLVGSVILDGLIVDSGPREDVDQPFRLSYPRN